jgi:hypothetical protein
MTLQELINYLNEKEIMQTSIDWTEDLPENIWCDEFTELHGNKWTPLAIALDVDKHRHYELCTDVIPLKGGMLGVRYICDLYSEMSSCEDMCHTLEFFECEEVKSVTYKKKQLTT